MSDTTSGVLWLVMTLLSEDAFQTSTGVELRVSPPCAGFMPVYASREDAEREWPGKQIVAITTTKAGQP